MDLTGKLVAESPIYRGNARKTLFTRDGDGTHRFVSLPGEISGTAQGLMDAFIGQSYNRKNQRLLNQGLLNQGWQRLYNDSMPQNLISKIDCKLETKSYQRDHFFDLRMGIKLDEDRWAAAEANANYKMETVFRNAVFDLSLSVNDSELAKGENQPRLFYLLQEIKEGRFWFGAGKSRGLGNLRLDMDLSGLKPQTIPLLREGINHLRLDLFFDCMNPVLVGWNWGKKDPEASTSFTNLQGRQMFGELNDLPDPICDRLDKALGGPISDPNDWKKKLAEFLPRTIAIWLKQSSSGEQSTQLNKGAWLQIANALSINEIPPDDIVTHIMDENALTKLLEPFCAQLFGRLYRQMDQQIDLATSDTWVDAEINVRQDHVQIKQMLQKKQINQSQWENKNTSPKGIDTSAWKEFLTGHESVKFGYMLNPKNLNKSITNDNNMINFLKSYREKTRQELSQAHHIDFRAGGPSNRIVSRNYGKPYDKIFMRMLTWAPSSNQEGKWEIYISGGTIKGAFRKRASQILKTVIGESSKTQTLLDTLFGKQGKRGKQGKQGKRGKILFSDAYLTDPIDEEKAWCSVDGIKMNPQTARPFDNSKQDFLIAYGDQFKFHFKMDIQDISERDLEALSVLFHLLGDFQRGDIPVGGDRSNGLGWIKATVPNLTWLTSGSDDITKKLFDNQPLTDHGIWKKITLDGPDVVNALQPFQNLQPQKDAGKPIPRAKNAGFISHKAFGGNCGILSVEVEAVTPLSIRESGEPSYTTNRNGETYNGWDFFSLSPPGASHRIPDKIYAIPSRSIKGMLRNIYSIASDSKTDSSDLSNLNPVDSLFGYAGKGSNNSLAGRLSFSFGLFNQPKLSWFEAPHFYGDWHYMGDKWEQIIGGTAKRTLIDKYWRVFPHAPPAPDVKEVQEFDPNDPKFAYFRAIMPGSKAHFNIRFWNLLDEELQRLIWCIMLESDLAHKMGNRRYLGFGSIRLKFIAPFFLIDWTKRYTGVSEEDWQTSIRIQPNPNIIKHYSELKKELNADHL